MNSISYKNIDQLPTPSLVIDLEVVQRNINRMANYCKEHSLNFRPHTKTHKSIAMAKRQIESGAVGLTVAKIGEAKVMSNACDDILIGYPAFDNHRGGAVASLAKTHSLRVALDSKKAAKELSKACSEVGAELGILIDIDTGFKRTGVQNAKEAAKLAKEIDTLDGIRFDGLFTFPGHIKTTSKKRDSELEYMSNLFSETIDLLSKAGLETKIVSGGSTPTAFHSHKVKQLTEIRPGTYIYNDWNCVAGGSSQEEDCAAKVISTVISNSVPGKAVVDAGSKTLTTDRLGSDPENGGHGHISQYPEAKITRLSEEHGEIDFQGKYKVPDVGERITIIPNHICPCVNLQDNYYLRAIDGTITKQSVDARGLLV